MARISGTISQSDVRHLTPEARSAYLERLKEQCKGLYGEGVFTAYAEPNGDISYTYDHSGTFAPAPFGADLTLSDEEIEAIRHAKVFVANSAQIKLVDGVYVPLNDEAIKGDPAMTGRIKTLNVLESLIARVSAA